MSKFCAVIEQPINGVTCPLSHSPCVWAHRLTKECKYTENQGSLSPQQIAQLVGVSAPTDAEVQEVTERIRTFVKAELTS